MLKHIKKDLLELGWKTDSLEITALVGIPTGLVEISVLTNPLVTYGG